MQDYYKIHADALQYFKKEVREAFAAICSSFGFREEKVTLTDTDNLFQVRFSNSKIRIVVKGINWGMNIAIDFGPKSEGSNLYNILQLIKERKPEVPVAGNQIDQLFGYADYLATYAADILRGETTFFSEQEALKKQEQENAQKVMEVESARKLAEGYLKIDTSIGELIWRKPRPLLRTYNRTKDKFPHSFEVVFNPDDLLGYSQYEQAIISDWKIDLGEIVRIDEVICEISTDKDSVEVIAPHTGRLIWLLEEGIPLESSICIALLDLDDVMD
ncbi:MAG: lipoyl domain-containing protein [Pedobacter sp.]|uniref:biotin/lipoyl-containing protein n=1 Tax=Pedobacter sp. TaxID=1411316 RepID=UPI0035634141